MSSLEETQLHELLELQITPQKGCEGIELTFSGEIAAEFGKYHAAGFSSAFSNSDGPALETSHFQAEFSKQGHDTIIYDLIFVRHHSGGFIRLNSLQEAKSCMSQTPDELLATDLHPSPGILIQ